MKNYKERDKMEFENVVNSSLEDHEERISEIELELNKIEKRLDELQKQINNIAVSTNEAILRLVRLINEREKVKVAIA